MWVARRIEHSWARGGRERRPETYARPPTARGERAQEAKRETPQRPPGSSPLRDARPLELFPPPPPLCVVLKLETVRNSLSLL
jgi:hypothetical protein